MEISFYCLCIITTRKLEACQPCWLLFVNSTETKVNWSNRIWIEKLPPSNRPVNILWNIFLIDCWLHGPSPLLVVSFLSPHHWFVQESWASHGEQLFITLWSLLQFLPLRSCLEFLPWSLTYKLNKPPPSALNMVFIKATESKQNTSLVMNAGT